MVGHERGRRIEADWHEHAAVMSGPYWDGRTSCTTRLQPSASLIEERLGNAEQRALVSGSY